MCTFAMSGETINRSQKLDYALVSSLERDPLLAERLKRLRTVPGVGPITALTWVLEIGDVTRFHSIKNAISYCGLCGAEKRSADKVMDLRPPASACREGEGSPSSDAAGHCRRQEEERQDRCQQDRRLPALRLPARVPHGIDRDPRPAADAALSRTAGQADGADEEPHIRAAAGEGSDAYQATAAQGVLALLRLH
jgi:hypothetical protein